MTSPTVLIDNRSVTLCGDWIDHAAGEHGFEFTYDDDPRQIRHWIRAGNARIGPPPVISEELAAYFELMRSIFYVDSKQNSI